MDWLSSTWPAADNFSDDLTATNMNFDISIVVTETDLGIVIENEVLRQTWWSYWDSTYWQW